MSSPGKASSTGSTTAHSSLRTRHAGRGNERARVNACYARVRQRILMSALTHLSASATGVRSHTCYARNKRDAEDAEPRLAA